MEPGEAKIKKKYFFVKLNPPRPTFVMDMNDAERNIMLQHVEYWRILTEQGITIVYGPVFDPKGGYGVGVIQVDNDDQLKNIISNDPAQGLNQYEVYPMQAVLPKNR